MVKNNTINIGLIGLGYWGPHFARVIFESDKATLSYCCDLDKNRIAQIKKRYPAVSITSDYQDILKDKSVKAVIVVTPPVTHYKIVKDCLLAGKDVLVEKPITLKSEEADDLLKIARKKGNILMVDHIFLFNPAIQKLKQIIQKRGLGKIFYITGSYTALGPIRPDVNAMWDLAPHFLYTLIFLTNKKPLWIKAVGQSYLKKKTEDIVYLTIGFPNKILANIHVSWLYPHKVRNLVIVGSKKMAVFDDVAIDQKLRIYTKGAYYDTKEPEYPAVLKLVYREGDLLIPKINTGESLVQVFDVFIDGVNNRKLQASDGEEGKEVVRILEAAQLSLKKKGQRIKII